MHRNPGYAEEPKESNCDSIDPGNVDESSTFPGHSALIPGQYEFHRGRGRSMCRAERITFLGRVWLGREP